MYYFILIPVTKYFKIMASRFSLTTYVEVIMNSFIKNMFYKQRQEFQDAIPPVILNLHFRQTLQKSVMSPMLKILILHTAWISTVLMLLPARSFL